MVTAGGSSGGKRLPCSEVSGGRVLASAEGHSGCFGDVTDLPKSGGIGASFPLEDVTGIWGVRLFPFTGLFACHIFDPVEPLDDLG